MPRIALLSAGGTGGHLFPAQALAAVLARRGWTVHLATDHRVNDYARDFPAAEIHIVPSGTFTKSPVAFARAFADLARGYRKARRVIAAVKPAVVAGFGGYPTVPPLLAASRIKVPTLIHDQNAVLGRANKFLAPKVTAIATSFPKVRGAEMFVAKSVETGSPVRQSVLDVAKAPYPPLREGEPLRLLVFGGSQGARFMSDLVPPAIEALPAELRSNIAITQQCRPEDIERVRAAYDRMGVRADLQPFFTDMPARIAATHLVVSRSGASTVAELAVVGRPAIMVPLPGALDQDQKANAEIMARAGGGWMVEQRDMNPARLAQDLAELAAHPKRLLDAALAAVLIGRPYAAEKLADVVEAVADKRPFKEAAAA